MNEQPITMQSEIKVVPIFVTPEYLSSLDKSQLLDILQYKTHHLVATSISRISDREYMEKLVQEVEEIQAEIRDRP